MLNYNAHSCNAYSLLLTRLNYISRGVYRTEQKWHGSDKNWNCRVHRRLWTSYRTDKTSLFLCKNYWNRSSFCRIRAIFALSCKRPFSLSERQKKLIPIAVNTNFQSKKLLKCILKLSHLKVAVTQYAELFSPLSFWARPTFSKQF